MHFLRWLTLSVLPISSSVTCITSVRVCLCYHRILRTFCTRLYSILDQLASNSLNEILAIKNFFSNANLNFFNFLDKDCNCTWFYTANNPLLLGRSIFNQVVIPQDRLVKLPILRRGIFDQYDLFHIGFHHFNLFLHRFWLLYNRLNLLLCCNIHAFFGLPSIFLVVFLLLLILWFL